MALDSPDPTSSSASGSERVRDELVALCKKLTDEARRSTSTEHRPRATRSSSTRIDSTYVEAAATAPGQVGSETIATKITDHQRGGVTSV